MKFNEQESLIDAKRTQSIASLLRALASEEVETPGHGARSNEAMNEVVRYCRDLAKTTFKSTGLADDREIELKILITFLGHLLSEGMLCDTENREEFLGRSARLVNSIVQSAYILGRVDEKHFQVGEILKGSN